MGLLGGGNSASSVDNSIDDDSTGGDSEGNFSFEAGNINLGGYDNQNTIELHSTDQGAVASAFEFASEQTDNAFEFGESAFDFADGVFDKSTKTLADVVNGAFSFASKSQTTASESAQIQQAQQSKGFTESLRTLNSTVSSALSQGSTDMVKYVMLGVAAIGIAYAIKSK